MKGEGEVRGGVMNGRILGLMVISVLGLGACHRADGKDAPVHVEQETPVRAISIAADSFAPVIEASGVLAAREEIPLAFKIGGVVARVLVEEGQRVRAGQTLAMLDPIEIDAAVARARSALDKAERDLQRARNLYQDSVATLEQVQNATTAAEIARSDFETARFNQRYAVVVAPAAGAVLRRTVQPGQLVAAGQSVLVLGNDAAGVVVRVALSDRDAVRVRSGDAAEVAFDAFPGQSFRGRVRQVGAAAHPQTGTYAIEIALAQPPRALSGLIGRARIQPSAREQVTLVPIDAITEADGAHGVVYALETDTRVRRVPVTLGVWSGDRVSIVSGLDGISRIVTTGSAYLSHGAKVKIVP
ncbi:MAG: efflux RND transporter periplasmic adaptor subunit [Longimicrobiales bacterium]